MQERRLKQRRRRRTGVMFPITDRNDCIVPFDRSRIADRRQQYQMPAERAEKHILNNSWNNYRRSEESIDIDAKPHAPDCVRDFCISGELIASVNNIYNSQTTGRWKELELYLTPNWQFVCVEIWRTIMNGELDQYWLATCKDLKVAQEFFGSNWLAYELFYNASQKLR
jgi:hypothetical protein